MISHQGVGVKMELIPGLILGEIGEVPLIISFVKEYALSLVPPGDDMVEGVGKMNPRSSSHETALPYKDP